MAVLSKGNLFDPALVKDVISKVKGKSSLAILGKEEPIPFNGKKEFTFTMDSDVNIVAENGVKSAGGVTIDPVTIIPIKVEYGARVSDEFIYASEEGQIDILTSFNDGFAKKCARGLDLMAMHGVNPRTLTASTVIGTNHFDSKSTQTVTYDPAAPDDNIEAAVALVQGSSGDINGLAMSNVMSSALAKLKVNGVKQYPELAWGANPGMINGLPSDINKTVADASSKDVAILGDFYNMFQWGYAKEIPLEIIQYGNPDNSDAGDLKAHNQIYLRSEMYLGWGILDGSAFARVVTA